MRLDAPIIDIGGRASRLVDALLDAEFETITVLDISEKALAKSGACLLAPGDGNGCPRPADLAPITVAKWSYGASDWHPTPRVPRSNVDLQPGASAGNSDLVRLLL